MARTIKHTTSSRLIRATSLDPETFAPFGEAVQNPITHSGSPKALQSVRANQDTATKWLDVTHMENHYGTAPSRKGAKSVVNMFVCEPRALQDRDGSVVYPVTVLERHPFTPQMFVPVGVAASDEKARYLVIVAPTLPVNKAAGEEKPPPYPTDMPRTKRSLKDRLLGARPNPYTNDHASSTTPATSDGARNPMRKGAGPPNLNNIRAFIARGDQAVTYGPGTWHAPMVVLGERPIDFVVVQYANGVALEDCQEVEVGAGIDVDVGGRFNLRAKL